MGIGNNRQADLIDMRHGYFSNNPLGLWVHVFVSYPDKAFNTAEGQDVLADLADRRRADSVVQHERSAGRLPRPDDPGSAGRTRPQVGHPRPGVDRDPVRVVAARAYVAAGVRSCVALTGAGRRLRQLPWD